MPHCKKTDQRGQNNHRTKKPTAHSSTFGCPNTRATASQPKELEFCQRTNITL